jgi:hypothetical protein
MPGHDGAKDLEVSSSRTMFEESSPADVVEEILLAVILPIAKVLQILSATIFLLCCGIKL